METYRASLHADQVSRKLLTAHAHQAAGTDATWERHDLELALEEFDRLAALMPAVRARLAKLKGVSTAEAERDKLANRPASDVRDSQAEAA